MVNKTHGLLGISIKAGKLIAGTDAVIEGLHKKSVKLVIIANDTSIKTIENIKYISEKRKVNLIMFGTIFDNSKAIGKVNKAVLGVKDNNLAEAIINSITGGEEIGKN